MHSFVRGTQEVILRTDRSTDDQEFCFEVGLLGTANRMALLRTDQIQQNIDRPLKIVIKYFPSFCPSIDLIFVFGSNWLEILLIGAYMLFLFSLL